MASSDLGSQDQQSILHLNFLPLCNREIHDTLYLCFFRFAMWESMIFCFGWKLIPFLTRETRYIKGFCLENDGYTWGRTKALVYITNPCSSFHKHEIKTIIIRKIEQNCNVIRSYTISLLDGSLRFSTFGCIVILTHTKLPLPKASSLFLVGLIFFWFEFSSVMQFRINLYGIKNLLSRFFSVSLSHPLQFSHLIINNISF